MGCRIHIAQHHWFGYSRNTDAVFMEVTSYINEVRKNYAAAPYTLTIGRLRGWHPPAPVSESLRRVLKTEKITDDILYDFFLTKARDNLPELIPSFDNNH
ncbi:hypothetical protein QBC40DRAFT_248799 [Triangularia verruculosa]|uniref:Uncharacterized protein n=1 Tax=Triangularia verruculosa TaxID=2587418 RepID=A0AAN7B279_9PEZI|nr:hypothetical protein QBC40DRAFT_248799 [Triangularia verruculosa]